MKSRVIFRFMVSVLSIDNSIVHRGKEVLRFSGPHIRPPQITHPISGSSREPPPCRIGGCLESSLRVCQFLGCGARLPRALCRDGRGRQFRSAGVSRLRTGSRATACLLCDRTVTPPAGIVPPPIVLWSIYL